MDEVDPRTSLINALITLAVVVALAFVGFIVRLSKGEVVRSSVLDERNAVTLDEREPVAPRVLSDIKRRSEAADDGTKIVNRKLIHAVAKNPTIDRQELDRFEILVGCELLDDRSSSGSRVWLSHQGREFVAHLYFAESPERESLDGTGYGVGEDAWETVRELLRTRTARVFTRWQPANDEPGHYFAMIYVEGQGGADRRFLAEILVANGLADLVKWDMMLPDGRTHSKSFIRRLVSLNQIARQAGKGAFQVSILAQ